ncbi:hypothetical protein B0H13DRAFT_1857410 [Mycena leptocephala]|nr:hypothetical protein B0H13DRAFT_1919258 [Mycena leptocephala]KAJ7931995.1 hypothetical protein B0H13DRAFT_1857410 [Mycena leptocephala]
MEELNSTESDFASFHQDVGCSRNSFFIHPGARRGSGCTPEQIPPPVKPKPPPKPSDKIAKHKRLSKLQRTHGTARLVTFQRDLWQQADISLTSFLPPEAFLPSSLITLLLDVYDLLSSQDAVTELVKAHKRLDDHHAALFKLLSELKPEFKKIAMDHKAELAVFDHTETYRWFTVSGDKGDPALSWHLRQVNFAADLAYPYFTRKRPVTGTRLRLNPYRHRNVRPQLPPLKPGEKRRSNARADKIKRSLYLHFKIVAEELCTSRFKVNWSISRTEYKDMQLATVDDFDEMVKQVTTKAKAVVALGVTGLERETSSLPNFGDERLRLFEGTKEVRICVHSFLQQELYPTKFLVP